MSLLRKSALLKRLGAVAVMVVGLCALALPSQPAQARVNVGIGIDVPLGGWWGGYAYPAYYYPPAYYGYPYTYYRPAYYYPAWRYRRWCWYHPYSCRW